MFLRSQLPLVQMNKAIQGVVQLLQQQVREGERGRANSLCVYLLHLKSAEILSLFELCFPIRHSCSIGLSLPPFDTHRGTTVRR